MCFAPQRRALFWLLNVKKWSESVTSFYFSLGSVLRATTACTFLTSERQKVVRTWCALCILTWKCALRHNGVHFFDSQLLKMLRSWGALYILTSTCASRHNARRFSEPTFRPSGATHHWKNTVNRDFPTFSRACIFFLLTLSPLWSSLFFSSPLWLFPPLLFQLSILPEVSLLNFLRSNMISIILVWFSTINHSFWGTILLWNLHMPMLFPMLRRLCRWTHPTKHRSSPRRLLGQGAE